MAVIGGDNITTLADVMKRTDPNDRIAAIIEVLAKMDGILKDATWKEGNLPVGHQETVRVGEAAAYWTLLGQGAPPTSSKTAQVLEQCGKLESWMVLPKDIVELNGNTDAYMASEAVSHIRSFNNQMATAMFYGNPGINPEQILGFGSRFSSLSALNGQNILDGGSGTCTTCASIWCTVWGDKSVSGIYPKGSKVGLERKDYGVMPVPQHAASVAQDLSNTLVEAYQTHFLWKAGLTVPDWRQVSRVANIDVTALSRDMSTGTDLLDKMGQMVGRIIDLGAGVPAIYMNRTVREMMNRQARYMVAHGGQLSYEVVDGKRLEFFQDIPIRICDSLVNTESNVA